MFGGDRTAPARHTLRYRWLLGLALAVSVLAFAGPVGAQAPPSAVDQYVEDPPSAGGTTPKGGKGGTGGSKGLPPRLSTQIQQQGGADAQLLAEIATSPRYGAPSKDLAAGNKRNGGTTLERRGVNGEQLAAADPQRDVTASDTFAAAASAVQGGDAARLVALLVGLAAITLVALAAAGVRHRRRVA
jgi:hypothetical protein